MSIINSSSIDSNIKEELQAAIEIMFSKNRKQPLITDTNQTVDISGVVLNNFDFNETTVSRVKMLASNFANSTFKGAFINHVFGEEANFSKSNLSYATLSESNFKGSCFVSQLLTTLILGFNAIMPVLR